MKTGAHASSSSSAAGSLRESWTQFHEQVPLSLRVYLLGTAGLGVVVGLYCMNSALAAPDPYWLVLVFFQACASFFWVRNPVSPPPAREEVKVPRTQASVHSWEFFMFAALVCYSPEVMVMVALADGFVCSFFTVSHLRLDRTTYNLGTAVLYAYMPGLLFYRLVGQSPPLETVGAADGLWVLAAMAICAGLHWVLNIGTITFALWSTFRVRPLEFTRSFFGVFAIMLISALGPAVLSLLFRENALLAVLVSAPAILVLLSYAGAYRQQVLTLTESREFLQSSLDSLSSYIAVLDESGRVVATNQAWRTFAKRGWPFGDWIGLGSDYLGFCRHDLGKSVAAAEAIAEGIGEVVTGRRESFRLDYSCRPSDPETWYEVRVSRFPVSRPLRVVVAHQDITDKKLSESRLRESEERYRQFFEDDLTADFVADAGGRLTDCNPAFARIFGLESPGEAVGAKLESFFPDPLEQDRLLEALRQAKKLEYREIELRSTRGDPVHVVANLAAHFDADGSLREIEGYLFDDTRRKRLESALAEAQKMEAIGQLSGGIAHDFNNLLTVVTGYGEFLFDSLSGHRHLSEEAGRILNAATQAGGLTSKLLAFSRRQVVRPALLDLNQAVAETSRMLVRLIGEDIELSTRLAAEPAMVRFDAGQIEQIILNLAVNARDAMPGGGVLELETRSIEGNGGDPERGDACCWVRLRVRDSGAGMTAEVRRRAFEPFFTTKEKGKGTGLGLSTVYGIVQQNGGRVDLRSEPDSGTCVDVYLPKVAAVPADGEAPARESRPAGGETVLLVEDEEDIRILITNLLSSRGYRVLEAGDGVEAMELLESAEGPVDLLLTDMVMPRMGGWELVQAVRRGDRHPAMKVLFISAYPGEEEALEAAVASGREAYLPKPFTPEALLARVRQTLDA